MHRPGSTRSRAGRHPCPDPRVVRARLRRALRAPRSPPVAQPVRSPLGAWETIDASGRPCGQRLRGAARRPLRRRCGAFNRHTQSMPTTWWSPPYRCDSSAASINGSVRSWRTSRRRPGQGQVVVTRTGRCATDTPTFTSGPAPDQTASPVISIVAKRSTSAPISTCTSFLARLAPRQ